VLEVAGGGGVGEVLESAGGGGCGVGRVVGVGAVDVPRGSTCKDDDGNVGVSFEESAAAGDDAGGVGVPGDGDATFS
jgi:hypothetical protein